MKLINSGTMEPVIVILGDVSQSEIRQLGGILLGKYPSKIEPDKLATWILFDSFYKVTQAKNMIELGEI